MQRWFLIVLAVVAALLFIVDTVRATVDEPEPAPLSPSPSATTWSDECTADDLEDGACYTWDDIRDQPIHTQEPTP